MDELWTTLRNSFQGLLDAHPLPVIAVVLFGEELGIPMPIPGDLLMILAGVRVAEGRLGLWPALLVQELATLAGTCGLFAFSRRFGRGTIARLGRYLHLRPETLARAEAAIARSGGRAVVAGRLIPGLRIITPIAAGTLGLPWRQFLPAVALGAFLYILAYTLLGVFAGPAALALLARVTIPTGALLSLAAALGLLALAHRQRRASPDTGPLARLPLAIATLAGLGAGVVALLATNGAIGLAHLRSHPFDPTTPPHVSGAATWLRLFLGWPGFLVAAALLGAVVERLRSRTSPGRAIPPVIVALPVGLALLATLVLARSTANGGGPATSLMLTEVVRWLAFALALGEFLPLAAREYDAGAPWSRQGSPT